MKIRLTWLACRAAAHFPYEELSNPGSVMRTIRDDNNTPEPGENKPDDEHANLLTHGLGLLLSIVASSLLMLVVARHGDMRVIVSCAVYCSSLVSLYAASTLSHMFTDLAWRRFFRMLDQACIYLLIAGSFTPIAVFCLWHGWWPLLLIAMWVLALLGVMMVIRFGNLPPMARFTYGILGWLPVISLKALFDAAPLSIVVWFVAGGAFYSLGTLLLRYDERIRYLHAVWHMFVIAGSACHYVAILSLAAAH
jgi:hemolysin III